MGAHSVGQPGSFFRDAVAGEISADRPTAGSGTAEELYGLYRFNSEDYAALPTLEWSTILTVFTKSGKTDDLLSALDCLKGPEEE